MAYQESKYEKQGGEMSAAEKARARQRGFRAAAGIAALFFGTAGLTAVTTYITGGGGLSPKDASPAGVPPKEAKKKTNSSESLMAQATILPSPTISVTRAALAAGRPLVDVPVESSAHGPSTPPEFINYDCQATSRRTASLVVSGSFPRFASYIPSGSRMDSDANATHQNAEFRLDLTSQLQELKTPEEVISCFRTSPLLRQVAVEAGVNVDQLTPGEVVGQIPYDQLPATIAQLTGLSPQEIAQILPMRVGDQVLRTFRKVNPGGSVELGKRVVTLVDHPTTNRDELYIKELFWVINTPEGVLTAEGPCLNPFPFAFGKRPTVTPSPTPSETPIVPAPPAAGPPPIETATKEATATPQKPPKETPTAEFTATPQLPVGTATKEATATPQKPPKETPTAPPATATSVPTSTKEAIASPQPTVSTATVEATPPAATSTAVNTPHPGEKTATPQDPPGTATKEANATADPQKSPTAASTSASTAASTVIVGSSTPESQATPSLNPTPKPDSAPTVPAQSTAVTTPIVSSSTSVATAAPSGNTPISSTPVSTAVKERVATPSS